MISNSIKDIITELANIGVAKGATMLGKMMNSKVNLLIPEVNIIDYSNTKAYFEQFEGSKINAITVDFEAPTHGKALFLLSEENSELLVSTLTKTSPDDPNFRTLHSDVMKEVGNIVLNSIITSISQFISLSLSYKVPKKFRGSYNDLYKLIDKGEHSESVIICKATFTIDYQEGIEGDIMLLSDTILKYAEDFSKDMKM